MANQAQQAQNLEKVTDYVEETHLDEAKMAKAMSSLVSEDVVTGDAFKASREWATVKVKPEDVEFIMKEMEVAKDVAETALKQSQNNIVAALRKLLE